MANFATNVVQISSKWLILVNFQLFPIKSSSFFAKFQNLCFQGVHRSIFPDLQLFESFPYEVVQNDPQWSILPLKWFRLARNGQFWSIFNFSHLFPQKVAQIDLEWPILPDLQRFQSFPTRAAHFSPNFKIFISGGQGVTHQFSQICNFLNHFQLKWLKMTHNGQFCHSSGLVQPKMANFGQFSNFPIFSHKKQLRFTQNGQFHLIHNFSNLFPTKVAYFSPNFKIFISGEGAYIG